MNSSKGKNAVIVLLLVGISGLGYLSWGQWQELVGLRASKVDAQDVAALRKQLFDEQNRAKALAAQLAAQQANVAQDAGRARNGDAVPPQRGRGGVDAAALIASFQQAFQSPQGVRAQATLQKANVTMQYGALFRSLGLPADQVESVTGLLVERQNAAQDILTAAMANGVNPMTDRESLQKLVAEQQSQVDVQIQAALGDEAYSSYQSYQTTLPQRTQVNQLQQLATAGGVPLSESQVEQLVQNLGNNGTTADPTMGAMAGLAGAMGGLGGGARVNARTMETASSVLSPAQMQVIQAGQTQQQAAQQMMQLMVPAITGQGAPAAAGGRAGPAGGGGGGRGR